MKVDQSTQLRELRAELIESLAEYGESIQRLIPAQNSISRQIEEIRSLISTIPIQHRILRHLVPDEIGSRWDQILEADSDTCRWVLEPVEGEDRTNRQKVRNNFINWLRAGNDVLHISGNPGAGKSTLMKFIGGNSRTQEELRAWAGNKKLIFGQFYSWAAGTEAQRTLPGLLKSLLFQALSQHPGLMEHVFPRQIEQMRISPVQLDPSLERFQDFGSKQIQKAFDLLLNKVEQFDCRACFLIDGLDEFEGDDLSHEDLATKLGAWTAGGNIKLLLSSRPWRPFLTTFAAHQRLHLHELNEVDIMTYCIRQLEQDREIRRIGVDLMRNTIDIVVRELACHARGVFLWAHLVLDIIRQDIRRRYSISLLKAKLREYPSDLDDLYNTLREPIEKSPIDRKLSNRMLLLAAAAPKEFSLSALAVSWLPEDDESGLLDPNFPPSTKCHPYSNTVILEREQCVSERVGGLTRGFLELVTVKTPGWDSAEQKVRFCHRTARDYWKSNARRYATLEESWSEFNQSDPFGRIYLAELIHSRVSESTSVSEYLNQPFCRNFNFDTIRKFEIPLQQLLRPMWNDGRCSHQNSSHDQTISFLHYAAYCRLDQFVLSEVAKNSRAYPDSPEMSILLTSMCTALKSKCENYDLVLSLLQSHVDMGNMIDANISQEHRIPELQNGPVPVWVIALAIGLEEVIGQLGKIFNSRRGRHGKRGINRSLLRICRLLDELIVRLHHSISMTLGVGRRTFMQRILRAHFVPDTLVELGADQLLELAEYVGAGPTNVQGKKATDDQSSHPPSDWVLDTVRIIEETAYSGGTRKRDYQVCYWGLFSPTVSLREIYRGFSYRVF